MAGGQRASMYSKNKIFQQQEENNTGNTQYAGYDGIEPVQSQREPDKAAQNIEDKQKHKAHDGVEQQFQSKAEGLFEQLEKNGQKSRGHTDDQHDD